jgi:hypothetical protein
VHFNHNPGEQHWIAVKHILRYIRGTTTLGLKFDANKLSPNDKTLVLTGNVDSNYGNPHDGRSTCGYIMQLCGSALSYRTCRMKTVALSTAEAEYQAAKIAAQEVIYLRQLLESIGHSQIGPTILHGDNQAAIKISQQENIKEKTKHVAQHVHFIRQRLKWNEIFFKWIPSEDNVADIFTKNITSKEKFEYLRSLIGMDWSTSENSLKHTLLVRHKVRIPQHHVSSNRGNVGIF